MKKRFVFFLMVSGGLFLLNLFLPVFSSKDSGFYSGMIIMWICYTIADLQGYFYE